MSEQNDYTPNDAFGLLRSYSRHRDFVRLALTLVQQAIDRRAIEHDASKMLDDEFAGFARINAIARVHKFGSPEYRAAMTQERETIQQHFARNSHHPEYHTEFDTGGVPMTFLDVIEMVCDWWGARLGYNDSRMSWLESVRFNLESKGKHLSEHHIWLVHQVAELLDRQEPRR